MKFTKESVNELKNLIKTDDDFQKTNIENLDEEIDKFVTYIVYLYIDEEVDFVEKYYVLGSPCGSYFDVNIIVDESDKNSEIITKTIDIDWVWKQWMGEFSKCF